jgi:hypothetical protein
MFTKKVTMKLTDLEMDCLRSALSVHIGAIEKDLRTRKHSDNLWIELNEELKLSKKLEKRLNK